MKDKQNTLLISSLLGSIFSILICLAILLLIDKCMPEGGYKNQNVDSNVELGDSIKKINDSLKLEIKNLDSLKNVEIIEIKNLDNDSTVKLFYKLISE